MVIGQSPEIRVKDQANLDKLVTALGATKVKGNSASSLFGVPVIVDPHMPDGMAALVTDCPQCMPGSHVGLCERCFGVRRVIRLIKLS